MVLGAWAGWALLGSALGAEGWRTVACLCASYVGGSVNFAAVASVSAHARRRPGSCTHACTRCRRMDAIQLTAACVLRKHAGTCNMTPGFRAVPSTLLKEACV